jgi:exodeoxyribonuclease-3
LENDVWNHKKIKRQVGHTPLESEKMATLSDAGGFVDVGRRFVPPEEFLFTWWGYRHPQSFQKNYGWRLDHFWVTPPLAEHLQHHQVLAEARAWERPSDHVPVLVDLK